MQLLMMMMKCVLDAVARGLMNAGMPETPHEHHYQSSTPQGSTVVVIVVAKRTAPLPPVITAWLFLQVYCFLQLAGHVAGLPPQTPHHRARPLPGPSPSRVQASSIDWADDDVL